MSYNILDIELQQLGTTLIPKAKILASGNWQTGTPVSGKPGYFVVQFTNVPEGDYGPDTANPVFAGLVNSNPEILVPYTGAVRKVSNPPGNQKPVISFNSPASGTSYQTGASITVEVTATDDVAVTSVQFLSGTTVVATGSRVGSTNKFTGTVTAPSQTGSFVLTAKAGDGGGLSETATLTLAITSGAVASTISIPATTKRTAGGTTFNLGATTNNTSGPALTYSSATPAVATVSSSGLVTPLAAGTSVITVSQAAGNGYLAGSSSVTVTVVAYQNTATPAAASAGVSLGAASGDSIKFNNMTGSGATPVDMAIYLNGEQVAASTFYAGFTGQEFCYTHLGIEYIRNFAAGRIDL